MSTELTADDDDAPGLGRPLPAFVDWVAAVVIAVAGLAMAAAGSTLAFVVDRDLVAEGIESGRISIVVLERDLTHAEMLAFTLDVTFWTGIGLLVTGIALVVFAVAYAVLRHRARAQAADGNAGNAYRAYAVLGAVVTAVFSFIPFSPVGGGVVAGYLEGREGGRPVSAASLSGLLAVLPGLAIMVFVTVGIYVGLAGVGAADLAVVTTVGMLIAMLFITAYTVGLSAVGGFAGGKAAKDRP